MRYLLALLLLIVLPSGCAAGQFAARPGEAARQADRPVVTILVSIDGFRADYRERGVSPELDAIGREGISAEMRPSFPSKTFPNHWTLVTGLRPERHGIIANRFFDPARPDVAFSMASDDPFWWSAAEPVWIAAERGGIRTATMFWPGSNVAFSGLRPSDWQAYSQNIPAEQRVRGVIDWLRRPAPERPRFVTLYFDDVDTAGHEFGPDAPETRAAIARIDRAIGTLRTELRALGQGANLVVVSDHGMAGTSPDRVVRLDSFIAQSDIAVTEDGPFAAFAATPGRDAAVSQALAKAPAHVKCWARAGIPAQFSYSANPRIAPFLCLADVGWLVLGPAGKVPAKPGGAHGYDPAQREMASLFVASGPNIRPQGELPAFDNIAIEPFVRTLLHLPLRPDGDNALLKAVSSH